MPPGASSSSSSGSSIGRSTGRVSVPTGRRSYEPEPPPTPRGGHVVLGGSFQEPARPGTSSASPPPPAQSTGDTGRAAPTARADGRGPTRAVPAGRPDTPR